MKAIPELPSDYILSNVVSTDALINFQETVLTKAIPNRQILLSFNNLKKFGKKKERKKRRVEVGYAGQNFTFHILRTVAIKRSINGL